MTRGVDEETWGSFRAALKFLNHYIHSIHCAQYTLYTLYTLNTGHSTLYKVKNTHLDCTVYKV